LLTHLRGKHRETARLIDPIDTAIDRGLERDARDFGETVFASTGAVEAAFSQ
jgi:hypothetical protein